LRRSVGLSGANWIFPDIQFDTIEEYLSGKYFVQAFQGTAVLWAYSIWNEPLVRGSDELNNHVCAGLACIQELAEVTVITRPN
jgi:hypothetical protein